MKFRKFWKYAAATAVLFTTTPMCVFAQQPSVTVPDKITTQQKITIDNADDAAAGIEILLSDDNTGEVKYDNGTPQNVGFTAGIGTIQLNGVDIANAITPVDTDGLFSAGVLINNTADKQLNQKTINTGNINITGNFSNDNGVVAGFVYYDNGTQTFDGTLNIGNIDAKNIHAEGGAGGIAIGSAGITGKVTAGNIKVDGNSAIGSQFVGGLQNGASVTLGNIDITSENTEIAYGTVFAGNIGDDNSADIEEVTVGNVNITTHGNSSGSGQSYGIYIDGNIKADGIFNAKDINVKDTGDLSVSGVFFEGEIAAGSTFNVGKIQAEGNGVVLGIEVNESSTFTVTNDVIAKTNAAENTGYGAFGIATYEDSNLTLDTTNGDIQISGIATNPIGNNFAYSIYMGGDDDILTIKGINKHTNKGQEFVVYGAETIRWETNADYTASSFSTARTTTHQVATGKTVVTHGTIFIDDKGAYIFGDPANNNSAGTLAANSLFSGSATVNNGLFALAGDGESVIGGELTIGNNHPDGQAKAAVALYGNVATGTVGLFIEDGEPIVYPNAVIDPTTGEKVLSLSTITEYKWNDAESGYVAQNRKRASLADGFLLPASIHNRITAWDATRDHLISGGQNSCESVCEPCEPCNPCNKIDGFSIGRNAWVNYVGRSNSYRSSYSNIDIQNGDWKIGSNGIQVGLDLYKTQHDQVGILFGYEGSVGKLWADRIEADDVYIGIYGAKVLGNGSDFRVIYNFGSQDYKLRRLDPGLGFNWNTHNSKFNGNTHELNLEFGKRIYSNNGISYRPVIGFDLYVNDWDGAKEDGNLSTAIVYDKADYLQAFLRIGSDLQIKRGNFIFNSGLYYSYDLNNDELKSKVFARTNTNIGYDPTITSTLYGSDLGRSILTFNIGGSYTLSSRSTIFGGFTGDATLDRTGDGLQSIGYVGLQWKW